MSSTNQSATSQFVDTPEQVAALVDRIADLPNSPPSLYLDLEGVYLCRHGSISILQIFAKPTDCIYLVDVHTLKSQAFLTTGKDNPATLKSILESTTIPKVFFDVRNDSDALHAHYNVRLSGIHDLQLMELATRHSSKKFVIKLGKCIEKHATMTTAQKQAWQSVKEEGMRLFAPERGGSYEVFNHRPLRPELMAYCIQDVQFMPGLYTHYQSKMTSFWQKRVDDATTDRVAQSQSPTYNGKGPHMALGPG
ncbi:MAG: hypothetical protein Q9183_003143 [Haloplaca sp. 2 TL-2023]